MIFKGGHITFKRNEVKKISFILAIFFSIFLLSCSTQKNTKKDSVTKDLLYFKTELPKKHKNLFSKITKDEFNSKVDKLINNSGNLNDAQIFVQLSEIMASIGDAHTNIRYFDQYYYPLKFDSIDNNIYIINADVKYKDMIFSKVKAIDGTDIDIIKQQLAKLIPHENDMWLSYMTAEYLMLPIYLYGLNIIKDEKKATFTVEKDGIEKDYLVTAFYKQKAKAVKTNTDDVLLGEYDTNYKYRYIAASKAFYFQYNQCDNIKDRPFDKFNEQMFAVIKNNNPDKIIIDLRNNSGGDSEVLNPFTDEIKKYVEKNSRIKVYVLIGRRTFSSGMFAIYRIKDAVPAALIIGEPTGGALDCYGDIKTFTLPNLKFEVSYSTKYFEFSKDFKYKNKGVSNCQPDIQIQPSIDDYKNGNDSVLNYVLNN